MGKFELGPSSQRRPNLALGKNEAVWLQTADFRSGPLKDIAKAIWHVSKVPIVLKNSKIAGLRQSRKCSALAISAAARLCEIDTNASDRFCGN